MKKQIYHEGYNYVLEYDNNSLIMYKEDIDEWMGDIEYIKVFTVEGDTPRHLNDVARLIGYLNKTLLYLTAFLFCLVTFCWTLKVRKNTNIWRPFTVGKSFISMLAVLLLCFAIVTAVGPQRVFYALHEWIFAGMAPWHFYFQDSLMTTMLTEPLFGSISILLVGTAFVFWLLLSALIKRILA